MKINNCGLHTGVINYLQKISLYGLDSRYSSYFNREVINLNISKDIQIDVVRDYQSLDKIVVVELGIVFKIHKILPCEIYSCIRTILSKEQFRANV
jgi:hypothetical protein